MWSSAWPHSRPRLDATMAHVGGINIPKLPTVALHECRMRDVAEVAESLASLIRYLESDFRGRLPGHANELRTRPRLNDPHRESIEARRHGRSRDPSPQVDHASLNDRRSERCRRGDPDRIGAATYA